jgi:F-type H+-transporting ATPase subunit b
MKFAFGLAVYAAALAASALPAQAADNPLTFDPGPAVWSLLTFAVLVALLGKVAFKPIAEALDRRSQTIKQSLDEAEKARAEGRKLLADYENKLADARVEANKIIEEGRSLGENVRKETVEKANAEAAALLQRAREEIERQKQKGVQELKDTVAALSVQIASRVIEKELNEAAHRQLIENLIRDLSQMAKS